MKCLNDRFLVEPATALDSQVLLKLLEQATYDGDISLLYTRRPDAYASFLSEGKEAQVLVCRDTKNNTIIGMGAYVIQDLYINGIVERVAYIFGLRGNQDSLKIFPLLPRFYEYLGENLQSKRIRICYTTILKNNVSTQRLLEKRRTFMPDYEFIGNFESFCFRNIVKTPSHDEYIFSRAALSDMKDVTAFLNKEGKRLQFYPVVSFEDIANEAYRGIHSDNFYIVRQDGEIVAAGALWNQGDYKQYIVQKYSGVLNFLKAWPFLSLVLGIPEIPSPGRMLKFCTLARWAVKSNDAGIFNFFLDNILIQTKDYSFCVVGIHESHPLRHQLVARRHIKYESNVYLVDWNKQKKDQFKKDSPVYIECGAL
jgi:hypothetical protein